MACSMPPMYWSTGIQWRAMSWSKGTSGLQGSVNRRKYHDESTNVSMVSVSRVAGPPHTGHLVFRNSALVASGERPVGRNSTSSGASTGSWSTGTGTMPCSGQYTIGMGHPQNRWRETNQSRNR